MAAEGLLQAGAPVRSTDVGDRIMKVNHAGEHGAVCIYTGQLHMARFTARDMRHELSEFRCHERRHRALFEAELLRRAHPRCRSYWLCALGGYALGVITGLFGRRAIAATTIAVERVVLAHLERQYAALHDKDSAAAAAVAAIVAEEREHHARSAARLTWGSQFWPRVITPVVAASTEAVIWVGMRL